MVSAKTAPTDAMAMTRSPRAAAVAKASSVIRNGPMRVTSVAAGSTFAAANTVLLTTTIAATNHSGASARTSVAGRMPPDGQACREGDERDDQRRLGPRGRSPGRSSQTNAIASLVSGPVRPSGLPIRSSRPRACGHDTTSSDTTRPSIEPDDARRQVRDEALVVGRSDEAGPRLEPLVQDGQQALVAMPILAERRLVEDEHRRTAHEDRCERQPSLLPARQSVRAARAERPDGQTQPLHQFVGTRDLVRVEPEHHLVADGLRQELALRFLEHVAAPASQDLGGQTRWVRCQPSRTVPRSGVEQADQQPRERRLAAAVRSDECDALARRPRPG